MTSNTTKNTPVNTPILEELPKDLRLQVRSPIDGDEWINIKPEMVGKLPTKDLTYGTKAAGAVVNIITAQESVTTFPLNIYGQYGIQVVKAMLSEDNKHCKMGSLGRMESEECLRRMRGLQGLMEGISYLNGPFQEKHQQLKQIDFANRFFNLNQKYNDEIVLQYIILWLRDPQNAFDDKARCRGAAALLESFHNDWNVEKKDLDFTLQRVLGKKPEPKKEEKRDKQPSPQPQSESIPQRLNQKKIRSKIEEKKAEEKKAEEKKGEEIEKIGEKIEKIGETIEKIGEKIEEVEKDKDKVEEKIEKIEDKFEEKVEKIKDEIEEKKNKEKSVESKRGTSEKSI